MDFTSLMPDQISEWGRPCPELAEALKTARIPPKIDWSNFSKVLSTFRGQIEAMEKEDQKDPAVVEETLLAPTRDGFDLPLKVWRAAPTGKNTSDAAVKRRPLIVLYYGGGFIMGSPGTLSPVARSLAKRFNAVVVGPAYRVAPEHPFPVSFNDGWDALAWIAAHAESDLHCNPLAGFIVGGVSSGGNISNAIAHQARDSGLEPKLTGVWLCCAGARPTPTAASQLPSTYRDRLLSRTQEEIVNGPFALAGLEVLKRESLKADLTSHIYSPLVWPTAGGHRGFPRTYSQICGIDPPRDESLVFDDMLKREGIATRVDLYPGLPHIFFHTLPQLPQAKR